MKSTSSRWSRRTFESVAEKVERSAKRRGETSEGSEGHVTGPDDQELPEGGTQDDPEMTMENHETKETSSSGESGQRSAERRKSSMQGWGVKREADDELQEERVEASRTRSTAGGDELPIPEANSSVAPNGDGEVAMGGSKQSTQLKRPQNDEPAQEDQPQARRARLQILCSFVHGNLDQGEDMHQEAVDSGSEWKPEPQRLGRGSLSRVTQPSGTTTGRLGGRKRERNNFLRN